MAAITICSDFGAPQNKVWHCFHIYLPWSIGIRKQPHFWWGTRGLERSNGFSQSPSSYERARIKTEIMASSPITSWQIDVETVSDFIFGGSKITADGNCSHESKRHLLLGRKVLTNLDSIFKSRDITLPTKVCLVKTKVFPVVMYGCESWIVKKA